MKRKIGNLSKACKGRPKKTELQQRRDACVGKTSRFSRKWEGGNSHADRVEYIIATAKKGKKVLRRRCECLWTNEKSLKKNRGGRLDTRSGGVKGGGPTTTPNY